MKVRVSQPTLVPDLVDFLGRASCTTDAVHGAVLDVSLPGVADEARAQQSIALYLAAWRGLHPPVQTTILD